MAFEKARGADRADVRELPKNIEAEQVVLGAAILEPERCLPILIDKIQPSDFYERRHNAIFSAMIELFSQDEPCDIVLLANRLEETGDIERAGGRMYLNELLDRTTTTASLDYYADIVKRKATLRQIIEVGGKIAEEGYNEDAEVSEVIDKVEGLVFAVSDHGYNHDDMVKLSEYLPIRIKELDDIHSRKDRSGVTGIPTGIDDLDSTLSGMQKSDLIVIAGRPGTGKSAFATTVTANAALKTGAKVVIFSLEMSKEQVTDRILTATGLINLHKMRSGRLGLDGFREVMAATSRLIKTNVFIQDTPGISILEIRSKSRRLATENNGIDIVIVDYVQLVEPGMKFNTREQEVGYVSRSLKRLARELKCIVIACSQLNRKSTTREDTRPRLADLRESGSIEQDADVVIFTHRPGFSGEDEREADRTSEVVEIELIIGKQRNGPCGIVRALFHKAHTCFRNHTWGKPVKESRDWNL